MVESNRIQAMRQAFPAVKGRNLEKPVVKGQSLFRRDILHTALIESEIACMSYRSNLTVSVSPGQIYICTQYGGIQIPMADVRPLRDHLTHIIQRDEIASERFADEDREAVAE